MSESTTETAPQEALQTLAAEPEVTTQAEPQEQAQEVQPEAQQEGEDAPKKDNFRWVKPAIDRLTREKHDARRQAEQLQRELAVWKAMAEGKTPPEGSPAPAQPSPTVTPDEVQRQARAIVEQERVQARTQSLIDAGVKELGQNEWNEKTTIVANLGATENPAFMRAIVTVPNGHKVVAQLADNPDSLPALLRMDPVEMAAELGRIGAELTPPKPRRVSQAPAPGAPVGGRAVPEPSLYDPNLSMKEWSKLYDKQIAAKQRRA